MQLIVEAETTLDIDTNMAAVEETQKLENLDFEDEDLNKKKTNGTTEIVEIKTAEKTDKEVISLTEESLPEITSDEPVETVLSDVDLSEENSVDAIDAQNKESQEISKETNGVDSVNKQDEDLDDEYLEDDIISIREAPYKNLPELNNGSETVVTDENDGVKVNTAVEDEKDVIEIMDEITDSEQSEQSTVKELNVDTVKEEPKSGPVPCDTNGKDDVQLVEKDKEKSAETESNSKDSIELSKESDNVPVASDLNDDVELIEEPKDVIEILEETEDAPEESEVKTEQLAVKEKDVMQIVEEVAPTQCENETKLKIDEVHKEEVSEAVQSETSVSCEISNESAVKLIEQDKTSVVEEAMDIQESESKIDPVEEVKEISTDIAVKMETSENSKKEETSKDEAIINKPSNPSETEIKLPEEATSKNIETSVIESVEPIQDESDNSKTDAIDPKVPENVVMEVENIVEETKHSTVVDESSIASKDDKVVDEEITNKNVNSTATNTAEVSAPVNATSARPLLCKLSNTLDILSDDDDEETPQTESPKASPIVNDKEKQCINIDDDDDIMLIDENTSKTEGANLETEKESTVQDVNTDLETGEKTVLENNDLDSNVEKETTPPPTETTTNMEIDISEKTPETPKKPDPPKPLLPDDFLQTAKKKLAEMTRRDLEEFCVLKIVESVLDRSSLKDIKNKLDTMSQAIEEHRKKAFLLTKQNRDLQVVLKSVHEEQKKSGTNGPVIPLKITRSVGMQVCLDPKGGNKKKPLNKNPNMAQNKPGNAPGPRPQKPANQNQNIPVPRLVPANNPALKTPNTSPQVSQQNTPNKAVNLPNGIVKTPSSATKAEKRPHKQMNSSVTVDLTDDEPPPKMLSGPRASPSPPVRLVSPQNLLAPRQSLTAGVNSPRKVYIPISGTQNQQLRPGQTIMLKTVPAPGMRPRCMVQPNSARMTRVAPRHPAPLPFAAKQSQPPNWKSLPPPPDLKLSKVENGIVISWKIEGVPEDSYEEIASYQLYAYQETSSPPSTSLWKKIGDVKALPLPMACTLTQFMAGYKYYFAVRAVDIRSRLGPFSLPGSIILISKNI